MLQQTLKAMEQRPVMPWNKVCSRRPELFKSSSLGGNALVPTSSMHSLQL